MATVVNGQLPGPQLRFREGEEVTIRIKNTLASTTSIHWHGLIVPADQEIAYGRLDDGRWRTYVVSSHADLDGDNIARAALDRDALGMTHVRFDLTPHGTELFHAVT